MIEQNTTTTLKAIENLQQLSELLLRRREQLAKSVGLTVQEWKLLEEIQGENFIPSLFARERESSRAAVSKILRNLQEKDLVSARISDLDGRNREYVLTESGERVMNQILEKRQHAIQSVWMDLDEESLSTFTQVSRQLIDNLEKYTQLEEK